MARGDDNDQTFSPLSMVVLAIVAWLVAMQVSPNVPSPTVYFSPGGGGVDTFGQPLQDDGGYYPQ